MAKIPVVTAFNVVKRGLLAKEFRVTFACPHCRASLNSTEEEIGQDDACPTCGGAFRVSSRAKELIERAKPKPQPFPESPEELEAKRLQEEQAAKEAEEAAEQVRLKAEALKQERAAEIQRQEAHRIKIQQQEQEENERRRAIRLRRAGLTQLKEEFRDSQIVRKYGDLEWVCTVLDFVGGINLLLAVIAGFGLLTFIEDHPALAVVGLIILAIETLLAFVGALALKEFIRLSINVAQDTERILLMFEDGREKPWAKP